VSLPAVSKVDWEVIPIPYSDLAVVTKSTVKLDDELILKKRDLAEISRVGQMLLRIGEEYTENGKSFIWLGSETSSDVFVR
jgi:hypothetical protein